MATAKNILVGAARAFVSYGSNTNRPDLSSTGVFPYNISNTLAATSAASTSTPAFLTTTASAYWRDFGFTSTGVDISYEPGYSDVVVDQLLDAARLFQQSLRIVVKTELDEGIFENMNIVWGQQESIYNAGSSNATVPALQQPSSGTGLVAASAVNVGASPVAGSVAVQQLNINAGALGIAPVERTLVFVGNAPGQFGFVNNSSSAPYPITNTAGSVSSVNNLGAGAGDASAIRSKERVYVLRRAVQTETTAHALKRDAATVFPVSFRALPDIDRAGQQANYAAGSEYGIVIDRVYANS